MTYLSNRLSYLRIGLMLVASCLLSEITLYRFPDLFHVGGSNTTETVENDSGRTAKSQQPCYRRCTNNFDNLIFLNKSTLLHQAGLEDRKAILRYTGQLAGYLCARLVVPSPRDLLTPNHNFRKPVSSTLTWNDDFVRIRFIQDQSLVLIQEDTNTQPNNKIELVCSVNNSTIHTTELHSTRNSVIKDFYKVRGIVQGRGNNSSICSSIFLWYLDLPFYTSNGYADILRDEMHRLFHEENDTNVPTVCPNVVLEMPIYIQELADKVVNLIKGNRSDDRFGYLHLRRSDTMHVCNTTVEKVQEYLSCSFQSVLDEVQSMPMVMSTDEQSAAYIQGIGRIVESLGMQFVHLDSTIRNMIEKDVKTGKLHREQVHNYMIFSIVKHVAKSATFQLSRRRSFSCSDCDAQVIRESLERK